MPPRKIAPGSIGQMLKKFQPEKRRQVGGQKTNQVGTLHKGSFPKQIKEAQDSPKSPKQRKQKDLRKSSQTNIGPGSLSPTKQKEEGQLESRWQEFLHMQ